MENWNFSGLMKWRLGNSYAFWEKSMNPYVVSDMRHYVSDTKNQIMLRVAWKFKFGHQRKSASQRIENSEERVRYFNNGGPFIGFRVSPAWGRC